MADDLPIARPVSQRVGVARAIPIQSPTVPVVLPASTEEREDSRPASKSSPSDRRTPAPPLKPVPPSATGFLVSIVSFALIIWSMIVYMVALGIMLGIRYQNYDTIPKWVMKDREILDGALLGFGHALIVFFAIVITWKPAPLQSSGKELWSWILAIPALVLMLMINFGYGLGLRFIAEILTGERIEVERDDTGLSLKDGLPAILLICLQPAIVEEFFFRYLMLGHFRSHVGSHLAVLLSSVFFAAAHIGQIPALPVLFILGLFMGYARVYSGGLLLPILLHFFHNFCVLWLGPTLDQVHLP